MRKVIARNHATQKRKAIIAKVRERKFYEVEFGEFIGGML